MTLPDLSSGMDAKRTAMGSGARAPVGGVGADSPHSPKEERHPRGRDGLRFLRINAVTDRIGLSRRTLIDLVAAGQFPRPVQPSPHTRAWIEDEVVEWMEARIAERDAA